jgi:peptidoglycan hydrolase-like protein with peptidoglycan-binding domain
MKKLLMLACALLVVGPSVVLAQTYYGYSNYNVYGYGQTYSSCTNLSSDLSNGSRGSEVSTLQQFLVNQRYPGTGNWMVTGYYGDATEAAVRNFQANRGLFQSGVVDWSTRNAIREYSCGGSGYLGGLYGYNSYQQPYTYPAYPHGYGISLRLDSLSTSSGVSGTTLTLYGSGFETTYNTVRFGASAAYGAGSLNGTSLTVTVPNMAPGVYPITVTNGRGTSNSLSFTVIGNPYPYYNYGYNYGNYNYGYNYLPAPAGALYAGGQAGGYYPYQQYGYQPGCSTMYPYGCY